MRDYTANCPGYWLNDSSVLCWGVFVCSVVIGGGAFYGSASGSIPDSSFSAYILGLSSDADLVPRNVTAEEKWGQVFAFDLLS